MSPAVEAGVEDPITHLDGELAIIKEKEFVKVQDKMDEITEMSGDRSPNALGIGDIASDLGVPAVEQSENHSK